MIDVLNIAFVFGGAVFVLAVGAILVAAARTVARRQTH